MSQKIIVFDNEERLLYSTLSNRSIMYYDNNIDDTRNLAQHISLLKNIISPFFNKNPSVNTEHAFDTDGFFVSNNITLTDDISTIIISTILNDNISIIFNTMYTSEKIDTLLKMIDFINNVSGDYYNYVSIKCSKEQIEIFIQNGFYLDESNELIVIKDITK